MPREKTKNRGAIWKRRELWKKSKKQSQVIIQSVIYGWKLWCSSFFLLSLISTYMSLKKLRDEPNIFPLHILIKWCKRIKIFPPLKDSRFSDEYQYEAFVHHKNPGSRGISSEKRLMQHLTCWSYCQKVRKGPDQATYVL